MKEIMSRAIRGAMFEKKAFEQAYWNNEAVADSVIVVGLVGAVSAVIGAVINGGVGPALIVGVLWGAVYAVAGWLVLAALVWFAATKIFKTGGQIQTMLATHGLAYLPLLLAAFQTYRPGASPLNYVGMVAVVWYLAVLVVATRTATDSDRRKAVLSVLVGYALLTILQAIIGGTIFRAVSAVGVFGA